MKSEANIAGHGHLHRVAQEAKAGDVGGRPQVELDGQLSSPPVETRHPSSSGCNLLDSSDTSLDRRRDHPGTQGLGEDEEVTDLSTGLGQQTVRVGVAHHHQPILGLWVGDGVATGQDRAGLPHLLRPSPHHLGQDLGGQIGGEGHDVQGEQRPSSHRVDIAQGVGRSDGPVLVGLVHDGREEVGGDDERPIPVQPVDGRVVGAPQPHQQVRVVLRIEQVS